jgi:hypothetical protein
MLGLSCFGALQRKIAVAVFSDRLGHFSFIDMATALGSARRESTFAELSVVRVLHLSAFERQNCGYELWLHNSFSSASQCVSYTQSVQVAANRNETVTA